MDPIEKDENDAIDYEKLSYDPYTYKRVQRIRKKGLQHGVTVPKLNHQLTKPDKPRVSLFAMGVLSCIVFVVILALSIALYVVAIKSSGAFNVGELFANLLSPNKIAGALGLSVLGGIGILLFYIIILLIIAIPIILIIYMYRFVRTMFALSNASKEEFARGHRVNKYISLFMTMGVVCVALMVVTLFTKWTVKAKVIASVILILMAILMFAYAVIIILEKIKAGKWFNLLEDERKADYLAHDRALLKSKIRAERNRRIDTGMWR